MKRKFKNSEEHKKNTYNATWGNNDNPNNLQLLEDRYHRSLHNQIFKLMKVGGIVNTI